MKRRLALNKVSRLRLTMSRAPESVLYFTFAALLRGSSFVFFVFFVVQSVDRSFRDAAICSLRVRGSV
jgi:hypothetical protein